MRFSGAGASYQNRSAERPIKTVVTVERTMLMHADITCTEDKLSTYLWPMETYFVVSVYNQILDVQSGLSTFEIWTILRFDPVPETLSNCHVWGCPTYGLEPKLYNNGLNIPKWYPRS